MYVCMYVRSMCVCTYVYVCVYIYIYTHTHTYIHTSQTIWSSSLDRSYEVTGEQVEAYCEI